MTKEEIWEQLVERHPTFEAEDNVVKLTARGLRKLINQAWDEGNRSGWEHGMKMQKRIEEDKNPRRSTWEKDLLSSMFGKSDNERKQ